MPRPRTTGAIIRIINRSSYSSRRSALRGPPVLLFLALGAAWFCARAAWAHDPGLSAVRVMIAADRVEATVGFAPADLERVPADDAHLLAVQIDGVNAALNKCVRNVSPDNVQVTLLFSRPRTGRNLDVQLPRIAEFPAGHRQFLTLVDASGASLAERMLSRSEPSFRYEIPVAETSAGHASGIGAFFRLGVFHILTGYDHLLFLFGLLLVCGTFRQALKIITCFTLAHSLTLALAATGVVVLPSRLVESTIALSICYVGLENIFTRGKVRWRGTLTFCFGLVHGLGFASALRELGFGSYGIAAPLVLFNLGVEAGQLAVAALLFPAIRALASRPALIRRLVPACSSLIALAGAVWFVRRAFA